MPQKASLRHRGALSRERKTLNRVNLLPRLYPILDARFQSDIHGVLSAALELVRGGITLIQYRNKGGNARSMLDHARELKRQLPAHVKLIMNDRADLCLMANFDGVHLGQEDLSAAAARSIFQTTSRQKPLWVGISTHNPEQLRVADTPDADYLAIGPVFPTASKENPDPVLGLEGVKAARGVTRKPLVAIGGVTPANARAVIDAGADSVAVISGLLDQPRKSVEAFLRVLG